MKVLKAITVWCNEGTSDKVYSLQILDHENGEFSTEAQYGRRDSYLTSHNKYRGRSLAAAEVQFNKLVREKGKKYKTIIDPPIIPFESLGVSMLSKEEGGKRTVFWESFDSYIDKKRDNTKIIESTQEEFLDSLFSEFYE